MIVYKFLHGYDHVFGLEEFLVQQNDTPSAFLKYIHTFLIHLTP